MKNFTPKSILVFSLLFAGIVFAQGSDSQDSGTNLAAAINKGIIGSYKLKFTPIDSGGLGEFPWVYENTNQYFNESTFNYISARVMPGTLKGTAMLSAAGGFVNAYVQVISKLTYTLSSTDQLLVSTTSTVASLEGEAVVKSFQENFYKITLDDMATARQACGNLAIQTNLDYVISYMMGCVWSGRGREGKIPLTTARMTNTDNLQSLLPFVPAKGTPVVAFAATYLAKSQDVAKIMATVQAASWQIHQLNNNTRYPDSSNGGMKTVNPQNGTVSTSYQPGYTIPRAISDIEKDLSDTSRTFKANIYSVDASGIAKSSTAEFSGYTYVPILTNQWNWVTGSGWYASMPIAEATANGTRDVTGYKFVSATGYNMHSLAMGGDFGRLTGLLICNSIKIIQTAMPDTATGVMVKLPTTAQSPQPTPIRQISYIDWSQLRSQGGIFTLFPLINVPLLQKQAYVIGGTLDFPGQSD